MLLCMELFRLRLRVVWIHKDCALRCMIDFVPFICNTSSYVDCILVQTLVFVAMHANARRCANQVRYCVYSGLDNYSNPSHPPPTPASHAPRSPHSIVVRREIDYTSLILTKRKKKKYRWNVAFAWVFRATEHGGGGGSVMPRVSLGILVVTCSCRLKNWNRFLILCRMFTPQFSRLVLR